MKNLLIPTDLSECTNNTIRYAISLGVKIRSKFFFYHASENKEHLSTNLLKNFIKKVFTDLNFNFSEFQTEFIYEVNNFSNQQIVKLSNNHSIDLIIMGASHESLKTTFFGSHVSDLINDVNCPVLSIPHDYDRLKINSIGYASELYDLKDRIKEVIPFAKLLNASIEIFHVYPVFPQVVDVEKYDVEKELAMIKSKNNYDKINIQFIKTPFDNEPITGIRQFIKTSNPDMLVMCHKPRGLFDKFALDSGTTISVVKSSQIPVLALNRKTACKLL